MTTQNQETKREREKEFDKEFPLPPLLWQKIVRTADEAVEEYKKEVAKTVEEVAKRFRCGKCDGAKLVGHAMWCNFKSDLKNKLNL